jgi:hypothetical protein
MNNALQLSLQGIVFRASDRRQSIDTDCWGRLFSFNQVGSAAAGPINQAHPSDRPARRPVAKVQGTISVTCPAMLNWMTPAQAHINMELSFKAGMLDTSTVGEPGAHGAGSTGMQGMGVSAPMAAAVAAATVGFARLWHMPNGGTFIMGTLSMMLPASIWLVCTIFGVATKVDGAMPNEHFIKAPVQQCRAMELSSDR